MLRLLFGHSSARPAMMVLGGGGGAWKQRFLSKATKAHHQRFLTTSSSCSTHAALVLQQQLSKSSLATSFLLSHRQSQAVALFSSSKRGYAAAAGKSTTTTTKVSESDSQQQQRTAPTTDAATAEVGEGKMEGKSVEELLADVAELGEEVEELQDKYRRALAETENVRRQSHKHVEDARHFAIQSFCKDLLEVADVLTMATNSISGAEIEKLSSSAKSLYSGVVMTQDVLKGIFAKHGLVPITPEGQLFDPHLHEALYEVPRSETKHLPGHVATVVKIGYALKGRTIRPAKVGVVSAH